MYSLAACVAGFLLDLCIGDPEWMRFHPVRLIGRAVSWLETLIRSLTGTIYDGKENKDRKNKDRKNKNKKNDNGNGKKIKEFIGGAVLSVIVCALSYGICFYILHACEKVSVFLRIAVESILCCFIFATKSLKDESMKVYYALKTGSLEQARHAVSMIVGRDTQSLDETGVAKAAVETVAENTSDGIIAPMFYMIIGGAPLGYLYKAINTMDSMLGYKNERYMYFGRFAARLDDAANFIPSRLAGCFMLIAAFVFPSFDHKGAFRIYKRDRKKSESPNAPQTESVCAGALRIRLLGDAYYFGKLHKKEYIGDDTEPVTAQKIKAANKLMYGTSCAGMFILAMIKLAIIYRL